MCEKAQGFGIKMMRKGNNRNGAKTYLGFGIKIVRKGNNEQFRLELINCEWCEKGLELDLNENSVKKNLDLLQDSQTMVSGYAYDDNYKIRLSDDVKANEEMKDEWMNEEMDSGRIYECKSL